MMQRHHDWPERLHTFIESRRHASFAWGKNDCVLFFADAILAMTGVDLAEPYRGYSNSRQAAKIVIEAGGMKELALQAGLKEKPIGFVQRGEGVLVVIEERESFGVVTGTGEWCAPGASGLVFRPVKLDARVAFEV